MTIYSLEDINEMIVRIMALELRGKVHLAEQLRNQTTRIIKKQLKRHETTDLWACLGDCLSKPNEKEAAYRRALALDSGNYIVSNDLAEILSDTGQHTEAMLLIGATLEMCPEDYEIFAVETAERVYREAGDEERATWAKGRLAELIEQEGKSSASGERLDLSGLLEADPLETESGESQPSKGSLVDRMIQSFKQEGNGKGRKRG